MRTRAALAHSISDLVQREVPAVIAMAVCGSRSASLDDDQSDLDLVMLLDRGPLFEISRGLRHRLEPLLREPVCLVGGPSWKEGFGCRTSFLYEDGFSVEIYANTVDTVPVAERVLSWTPLWGASHVKALQARVAQQLDRSVLIAKAQFDVAYTHMSVCRHLARKELFAARHVLASLTAVALAIRLTQLGLAYDPVSSCKRIHGDGLGTDPVVREIERVGTWSSGNAAALEAALSGLTRVCRDMLDDLSACTDRCLTNQSHLHAITSVPESWLPADA